LVRFGGEEGLMDKRSASLTDWIRETFFTEVELFSDESIVFSKDVVCCETIQEKEMFYNAPEQEQVTRLEHLLDEDNFKGVQERLEEMGMRKGFNIILYGGPGTGKTETTLQIARKTGRDIFFVDMSKLKSKWVGDSEKAVKGIFNIYRGLCKRKPVKPILFFNEADAIFGKRMENVESSAAQMLNSLQNIILQEMETMEGILICTTNLHGNLDPAFERRFIYKVALEKPGEEVRNKIWKSMMKDLNDEDCAALARRYPFSGGQIENVVRKSTVDYILYGQKPELDAICEFCEQENFQSKVRKVGF
jgi:ATP-dependent 26S proteasome regulatory subunit